MAEKKDPVADQFTELRAYVEFSHGDLSKRIDSTRADVARVERKMDARFDAIDSRFEAVDARFEAIDARFDRMDARFDRLESKIDALKPARRTPRRK